MDQSHCCHPKKSGEVRICIDMCEANQAVKREKHVMPTIDDLVADLNGSTVFTTLDLSSGFQHTPCLFGINAASKIFQNTIEELLTGLLGCKDISDDIIIFGNDQATHDANLHHVLERPESHNLRISMLLA